MKTKKQVIIEELRKIKGIGDFELVAETEKVALKKSRITKQQTPKRFEKISKITLATVSMDNDYEKEVNNRLLKEGKEDSFKSQGTYCIPLSRIETGFKAFVEGILSKLGINISDKFSKVLFKHKEKDQLYVRVYPNLAKVYQSNSVYFDADGKQLTKEEFKEIEKEYLPLRSEAAQGGLEDKIIVNNYKLENIIYLGNAEKTPINELDQETLELVTA